MKIPVFQTLKTYMIYSLIRHFLFCLSPETAHKLTLKSLKWLQRNVPLKPSTNSAISPYTVMGLPFPNRVGLAAGLDKNGEYIDALASLGFGFIEVGSITPKAQLGNPKPRLFRLPQVQAIINRMGFNNYGVDYLIDQLKKTKFKGILGINLGKNVTTPLENAADDYVFCLRQVYPYASYVTINISSPNTPGLRQLQTMKDLEGLLKTLKQQQLELAEKYKKDVPLVIKIAPDLSSEEIKDIAALLLVHHIDGVIATNTTLSRSDVQTLMHGNEAGGLSGKPLFNRSLWVVQELHKHLQGKIPIIACGGISTPEDAQKMLTSGANLLQIYTGLIYQGPGLIKRLIAATSE